MPEVELPLNLPVSAAAANGNCGIRAASILVIDDEAAIRESLEVLLTLEGYTVRHGRRRRSRACAFWRLENFDLVLLDLALPGQSGLELLPQIKERQPELPVIMITAYGTVDNVVEAVRAGAENFVQKPWDNEKLLADIRSAVARHHAEEENLQLKRTLKQRYNFANIVGKSEIMLQGLRPGCPGRAQPLHRSHSGRERHRQGTHRQGHPRQLAAPRQALRPHQHRRHASELLESTLFGHVKGAFTSAIASKKGLFEVANGGTLFLDEIATMGMDTQAKILRVLQDRRFMHLGGIQEIQVDVRIIAATNVDLRKEVRDGRFREDLFYRLNVITVDLPPLRARREDIPLLAKHFLEFYANENGFAPRASSPPTPCARWSITSGPAMCASWKTPSNAAWCFLPVPSSAPTCCPATSPAAASRTRCSNTIPTPRSSTSSKTSSAASSSKSWSAATGTRPTPPSSSASRSPRSTRRSSG